MNTSTTPTHNICLCVSICLCTLFVCGVCTHTHTHTYARTHARTHKRTHARTHAHTHKRTHTQTQLWLTLTLTMSPEDEAAFAPLPGHLFKAHQGGVHPQALATLPHPVGVTGADPGHQGHCRVGPAQADKQTHKNTHKH